MSVLIVLMLRMIGSLLFCRMDLELEYSELIVIIARFVQDSSRSLHQILHENTNFDSR